MAAEDFVHLELVDDTEDEYDSVKTQSQHYPEWSQLPPAIQDLLNQTPSPRLWGTHGLLSFRYGSSSHRDQLILTALKEIRRKIDSGRDHSIVATYLGNFFAHSVGLFLRRKGDIQTRDFYVADEINQCHRLVSNSDAMQTLCDAMNYLVEVCDAHLLVDHSPSAHRLHIDRLKGQLKLTPNPERKSVIQAKILSAQQTLSLRSMLTSGGSKLSVAKEYLQKTTADCLRRGTYFILSQEHQWLPLANGVDVNLETLVARKRFLNHHILGLANAICTIQPEDVDPTKLTASDRNRLFGPIPTLISRLAAENTARVQSILISLYLQLLGHNKHKYLIIYMGEGHNGKSLLLTLLREVLGELCAPLHKSILFVTKETASHSGFQVQLDSIRSGFMDDLGPRDTFNEQAVKMIVSPDVEMVMREAGHIRRGAAKARYRIGCSLLLCCNYGSLPQIKMDQALVNRFRIIPFEATFINQDPPADREDGKMLYRADPGLLDQLKQPHHLSQFLNYVIMAGRYYYLQNIKRYGEPLINEPQVQAELLRSMTSTEAATASSSSDFKGWWESYVINKPGESTPMATLAAAYANSEGITFKDPTKQFGQLLQTHYPHIVRDKKKQLMSTVDGIRAKRMVLMDYTLDPEVVLSIKIKPEPDDGDDGYSTSDDYC